MRSNANALDKEVLWYNVSTLEDLVSRSAAGPRFQTLLLACFGEMALVLAAIGYAVLSYMVVQRTLEIGLSMALGAVPRDVLRMVFRRGIGLAIVVGLAIALVTSVVATRFMARLLYTICPFDPVT